MMMMTMMHKKQFCRNCGSV